MRKAKWGRVINISGSMEPRGLNAAIAAKGALHLWAKGLSCDVGTASDGRVAIARGLLGGPRRPPQLPR